MCEIQEGVTDKSRNSLRMSTIKNNLQMSRLCAPLPFHPVPSKSSELHSNSSQDCYSRAEEIFSKSEVFPAQPQTGGANQGASQLFPGELPAGHLAPRDL